jgi:hypothetical protein
MSTIWEKKGWVKLPPEWAESTAKIKFELLGVGVSRGGTLWRLNAIGVPNEIIGNVADASADIADPETKRNAANTALVVASILGPGGPGIFAKTKVTKWEITVKINGEVAVHKTAQSISHAEKALKEVGRFNKLAEGWRRHRDLVTEGSHVLGEHGICLTCKQAKEQG